MKGELRLAFLLLFGVGVCSNASDYVELVDWAARIVRSDKKHAMSSRVPPILNRLGFTQEEFEKTMQAKAMTRGTVIAQAERLRAYAEHLKKRCVYGVAIPSFYLNSIYEKGLQQG